MEQRISFITIGVTDIRLMTDFYKEKFGWTPLKEQDDVVFFMLNGVVLALYPSIELAADAKIPFSGDGWKRVAFSINFHSESQVDDEVERLKSRGVNLIKAPGKVSWGGYNAYVEDAEFNLWELAFNPFLEIDGDGNVIHHK
jgi:uncharacterized protein